MAAFGSGWRDLATGILCLLLAGCGGGSNGSNIVTLTGFVRIVNCIPDSPTLNVGVAAGALARVSYAQSTNLTALTTGRYAVNVQYINGANTIVNVITNEPLTLDPQVQASVYLMGPLASAHTKLIVDPISVIAAGKAQIQIVHAAAKAGTVAVYLTEATAPLDTATPVTLAFEANSDLLTVDSGANYRLQVTAPGSATVLYDSGVFAIESEARPVFVLVDYFGPGGNGFRVVQLNNLAAATFGAEVLPGEVRVANMIAEQPAVDVYVGAPGAVPTFPAVAFGAITARQQFVPANDAVTVTAAGDPGAVLLTGTLDVNPGESRTLVVSRSGAAVAGRVSLDNTRPISVLSQLQIIQATPSAGNIDVYLLSSNETIDAVAPDFSNLPLLSVTPGAPAAAGYDVVITPTGVKTVAAGPEPVVLENNGIYSIYVADTPGGGLPRQIVLGDDFN